MAEQEREELLSAYLDGEVSPEERMRVEQWLAESVELRQLRDELVALRADLQSLPRHEVGHDLASVVMTKSGVVGPAPASATSESASDDNASWGNLVVEWWSRGSQGRRFLWPALALAAALAILIFDARQRPEEFEVAKAPETRSETVQPPAPVSAQSREQPSILSAPAEAADDTPGETPSMPGDVAPPLVPSAAPSREAYSPGNKAGNASPLGMAPKNARSFKDTAPPADATAGNVAESFNRSLALETIICPVTSQYLAGREFEKLLDANRLRWQRVPIPPQLQVQGKDESPRTAPLESLGRNPLQALYYIQAESDEMNTVLSQVPQADKLMEGNRLASVKAPQQQPQNQPAGVQVMLVAPVDAAAPAR